MNIFPKAGLALGLATSAALGLAGGPARADLTPSLTGVVSAPIFGQASHGIPDGTTGYIYTYSVGLGSGQTITGTDPAPRFLPTGYYVELFNVSGVIGVGNGNNNATFSFLTGTGLNSTAVGRNTTGTDIAAFYTGTTPVSGPVANLYSFSFTSLNGNVGSNNLSFTGHADTNGIASPNNGRVNGPITPSPEPSTLAPFALGGLGLLGLTFKTRRRARTA